MLGDDLFDQQKTIDMELHEERAIVDKKKPEKKAGPTLRERLQRGANYAFAVAMPYLHERSLARQPAGGKTPLMMVMSACKMTKRDASRFLRLFEKIDKDHSGTIDIEEFFGYLRLDISGYTRKAFAMMQIKTEQMGKDGKIDAAKARALQKAERRRKHRVKKRGGNYVAKIELHYAEFFVALFNFLTLNNERLVRFTFDLIDEDKSGYLSKAEVFEMVRLMASSEDEVQAKVQKLMNVLDANGDGDVEYEEFYRVHCKLSSLMFPAFRLRRTLRLKCMGNRFWRRCEKNREKIQNATGKTPLEIYKDIVESKQNAAFELAEAERLAEEARHAHDAFLAEKKRKKEEAAAEKAAAKQAKKAAKGRPPSPEDSPT